ncbi:MAG: hypothetical protein JW850_08430 [Thermoflexales bacterium]|nr:hypothetical protein [Thermoflexales bacterium]
MTSLTPKTRRWGLDVEHLWLLVVLAGFGFYTSLIPLPPEDFWWHLKTGEMVYTSGAVPATNVFAWPLAAEAPFVYGAWLGAYLMYVLYRWGGVALLLFIRTVLALATFGLVGYEARRRSGSWRLAALAAALAYLMSLNNLTVRTQMWVWLPFVAFLILLGSYASGQLRGRWLLACPLLMAFWVNVHGAFILGFALLGAFAAGEALRTALRWPGARSWKAIGWLLLIALLTAAAALLNPQGSRIFGYVLDIMTDKPIQSMIIEWKSPTPEGLANVGFFASILAMLVVWMYSRHRPTPTDVLLVAGFLWLAWGAQRNVIWFGLSAMPILAQAVAGLRVPLPPALLPGALAPAPQSRRWLNAAIGLLLFAPLVWVQPWFVERLPLPDRYWDLVLRGSPAGPLLGSDTPVAAAEYLSLHPGGRLFNELGYGSYLMWAVPEQGIFIDPRVELYPLEHWQAYAAITRGARYNALLAKYGADRIVLDTVKQPELARSLAADPLWSKEYEDRRSQIWRRLEAEP